MNKQEAERQADDLIGMNYNVPDDLTAPMQMKLSDGLTRHVQRSRKFSKIFWAGAAAIVIINAVGIGIHFFGKSGLPGAAPTTGSVEQAAAYYYTDKLNSY